MPRWAGSPDSSYCFIGQYAMGDAALRTLMAEVGAPTRVITRPHSARWTNPVVTTATQHGLEVDELTLHELTLEADSFVRLFASVDIAVCCGWPVPIAPAAFGAPRRGIVNLHPGALPAWRGSDPIGWHLAASAAPIVCTAHWMTAEVDAGIIVGTAQVAVDANDTGLSLRRACGAVLGHLAAAEIRGHACSQQALVDSSKAVPPRGTRPAFRPETMTTATAARLIRAFSPYPGAVVHQGGRWFGVGWADANDAATVPLTCLDGVIHVQEVAW